MTVVERQIHGYRQGHQLLAASAQLLKEDQSVVDRLSDVAGPLRPRERFQSYLTAYPLPSGERFVLARTWQDLTVSRAGCVRTLSLIVPMKDWADAEELSSFLDLMPMDHLPDYGDATGVVVETGAKVPLPPAVGFNGSELLEALFLEETRPVVVLDAADPDLIAIRLLTALWPSLRRTFALSTFALSPRKVAGRDFDLVFAPKDARAKFTDWNGRRVDGRSTQVGRHRWTGAIVSRVFDQPFPRLLSPSEVGLVGGDDADVDNAGALRIALLWDELVAKLDTTPTAALGLLDIANSGKVRDSSALEAIEPSLAGAARRASISLPEGEAWSFLGAIARKLQGRQMPMGRSAVAEAVEQLAARAPEGAVALLSQDDPRGVTADLLPRIASGMGSAFTDRSVRALLDAEPSVLGRLLVQGGALMERVADDSQMVDRLKQVLPQLDSATLDVVGRNMLPLLTEDWQIPAAEPFLTRLDGPQLTMELWHLGTVNDFNSARLSGLVLDRALSVVPRAEVRSALTPLSPSVRRDVMIARTLVPSVEDARWVANSDALDQAAASTMLLDLLRQADDRQLVSILVDGQVGNRAIDTLRTYAPERLLQAIADEALPLSLFVQVVPMMLDTLSGEAKVKLAKHILGRCLGHRFGDNEVAFLVSALSVMGDQLDGAWVARIGLSKNVDAAIASRNMVAFRKATQPARLRVVWSIAEVAQVLRDRRSFDLDEAAAEACAAFMFDAEKVTPKALLIASGHLLPTLLRSRNRPVSLMIAAAFPPIHGELSKADEVPDIFKFIPFFDWDRCKAARHELVDAFMSSSWPPRDLALTACRANEVARITRRVFKQPGGEVYLKRISSDLDGLPEMCRKAVKNAITQVRSNPSAKFDRRD
ncbi:MAG: hypothetical protein BVN32_08985 [Proteobacteria bacterium ST_bin14]|nr:MAG: hypothetical protein BVN32_08985 [Proteobacteria bacterium ST_bin14]